MHSALRGRGPAWPHHCWSRPYLPPLASSCQVTRHDVHDDSDSGAAPTALAKFDSEVPICREALGLDQPQPRPGLVRVGLGAHLDRSRPARVGRRRTRCTWSRLPLPRFNPSCLPHRTGSPRFLIRHLQLVEELGRPPRLLAPRLQLVPCFVRYPAYGRAPIRATWHGTTCATMPIVAWHPAHSRSSMARSSSRRWKVTRRSQGQASCV